MLAEAGALLSGNVLVGRKRAVGDRHRNSLCREKPYAYASRAREPHENLLPWRSVMSLHPR